MAKAVRSFLLIILTSLLVTAQAALPTSLNYQAYVTDSSGVAVNTDTLISFAIYNVDTGGAPLWSDSLFVPVDQGLISVTLGNSGNPFPSGLFDTSLWVGINIDGDGEMMPRRALSSVGFAFKADDALTLTGRSAAALDQSSHVIDTANPHAVSAAQVGAATQVGLDAEGAARIAGDETQVAALTTHAGDGGAHHARYGDAEAVLAMGGQDDTNPLNHTRYLDANAVAAMGPINNTNPLHHIKYNDISAVQAVLNADGAGSGLDADRLDGLNPQDIVLLANPRAFPIEIPLTGFSVNGDPVRIPPTPASDIILIGNSFGASIGVLGLFGGLPWTGEPISVTEFVAGQVQLRYRYPSDRPSPLDEWLNLILNSVPDVRLVELTIDGTLNFRLTAVPVYLNRTFVSAAGPGGMLIEETIRLQFAADTPSVWEFTGSVLRPSSGPFEITIDGQLFNGNVSLPDAHFSFPQNCLGGCNPGQGVVRSRGELILHDVGFMEFLPSELHQSISDAAQGIERYMQISIDRDGVNQLSADGCLPTQVSDLKETGIGEIRIVCRTPLSGRDAQSRF